MIATDVETLADALLAEHALSDWRFRWDHSVRRFGQCRYNLQEIGISRPLADRNDRATVEDCIRHEIAHAIAGIGAGHGTAWKRQCRITGARPVRCYSSDAVINVPMPWRFDCPVCGTVGSRHRKSTKVLYHCRTAPIIWRRA